MSVLSPIIDDRFISIEVYGIFTLREIWQDSIVTLLCIWPAASILIPQHLFQFQAQIYYVFTYDWRKYLKIWLKIKVEQFHTVYLKSHKEWFNRLHVTKNKKWGNTDPFWCTKLSSIFTWRFSECQIPMIAAGHRNLTNYPTFPLQISNVKKSICGWWITSRNNFSRIIATMHCEVFWYPYRRKYRLVCKTCLIEKMRLNAGKTQPSAKPYLVMHMDLFL